MSGNQWKLEFESGDFIGEGTVHFRCSMAPCDPLGDLCISTFSEDGTIGLCQPFPSLDAQNEYHNKEASCSLTTLSPADSSNTRDTILLVYQDSTEGTSANTDFASSSDRGSAPTTNILSGQELSTRISGCSIELAQRQGSRVCLAYIVSSLFS